MPAFPGHVGGDGPRGLGDHEGDPGRPSESAEDETSPREPAGEGRREGRDQHGEPVLGRHHRPQTHGRPEPADDTAGDPPQKRRRESGEEGADTSGNGDAE